MECAAARGLAVALLLILAAPETARGGSPPEFENLYPEDGGPDEESFPLRFSVTGEYSNWYLYPYSQKKLEESGEDHGTEWQNVDTYESYTIDPLSLYKVSGKVDAGFASVRLVYESNVGFDVDFGDSFAWGALLEDFRPEFLEPFSFEVHQLDFRNGNVKMKRFETDHVIDEADFTLEMTMLRASYRFQPLGKDFDWFLIGGYLRRARADRPLLCDQPAGRETDRGPVPSVGALPLEH